MAIRTFQNQISQSACNVSKYHFKLTHNFYYLLIILLLDSKWPGKYRFSLTDVENKCHKVDGLVLSYLIIACLDERRIRVIHNPPSWFHVNILYYQQTPYNYEGSLIVHCCTFVHHKS